MGGGLLKPKDPTLGPDVAGTVEAIGGSVTEFKVGNEAFGVAPGSFAEYACNGESKFALKPANVTFEAAAAVPVAGFTALQGLRDAGQVQPGERALIDGASGEVGVFAVQIAKAWALKLPRFAAAATWTWRARSGQSVRAVVLARRGQETRLYGNGGHTQERPAGAQGTARNGQTGPGHRQNLSIGRDGQGHPPSHE